MPRDLADVLHYFLPELDEATPVEAPHPFASEPSAIPSDSADTDPSPSKSIPALPILGLPIGDRDVVRTTLVWNLAIETTRLGGCTVIVTPQLDRTSTLWPEAGKGPLGSELIFCDAHDLASLSAIATDLAAERAEKARQGGIVFMRIPPAWLLDPGAPVDAIAWLLLLSSSSPRDLEEAFDCARQVVEAHPKVDLGLSVQGARSILEARATFETLADRMREELGIDLISYGLLVDDLNMYRAIAAQRPIGLAHPQAPATRALMDVARILYQDARSRTLG